MYHESMLNLVKIIIEYAYAKWHNGFKRYYGGAFNSHSTTLEHLDYMIDADNMYVKWVSGVFIHYM